MLDEVMTIRIKNKFSSNAKICPSTQIVSVNVNVIVRQCQSDVNTINLFKLAGLDGK
jgi:hypothetical protein